MYSYLSSTTINDIDIKFIQQLNKRLELVINNIKSFTDNTNLTNKQFNDIRIDLIERYELRNDFYHQKFLSILDDLSNIKSRKKYFHLIEIQHHQSIQFYKKLFNIQSSSSSNIEQYHQQLHQSIQYLNELKTNVNDYENNIDYLKQELIKQNNQIYLYSNHLFQIQYEQNQIQSNIKQLKQQILFEKQYYYEQKLICLQSIENLNQNQLNKFLNEYNHLSTHITEINIDIEQKSLDLLSLQSNDDLQAYHINENNFIIPNYRPLLVPTTIKSQDIHHQSSVLINKFDKNIMHSQQQQLPIESIGKIERIKFKSEKSKFPM
ncbi:unnamed protein product [Adineta steineri]|uniref:Uncharacterized protein n=1 Tax=Adineta steineri TaxID=433720 RepID=A0A813UF91_9BILA|nr:unnamed protein product [Adineta steineri]